MSATTVGMKRRVWRSALAFVAAYLLVLQAALAGLAAPHADGPTGFAAEVMCLNAAEPVGGDGERHAFDCCGVGCLVGFQTLQAPASPAERLVQPIERGFAAAAPLRRSASQPTTASGPGPRGPPKRD